MVCAVPSPKAPSQAPQTTLKTGSSNRQSIESFAKPECSKRDGRFIHRSSLPDPYQL